MTSPYVEPPSRGAEVARLDRYAASGALPKAQTRFSTAGSAALSLAAIAFTSESIGDGEIRRAARLISRDAHRTGMSAEQMLVALKLEWNALPEVVAMSNRRAAEEILSRIVTVSIHEYYLPTPQADPGSAL